jgi:hypothetical protein
MGTPRSPPTRLTTVPTSGSGLPEDPPTCQWAQPTWLAATRPPEDLLEDSSDDLVQHDHKTWRTRHDLGSLRPKQIDEIWQDA